MAAWEELLSLHLSKLLMLARLMFLTYFGLLFCNLYLQYPSAVMSLILVF
jgi:hypothetical protein